MTFFSQQKDGTKDEWTHGDVWYIRHGYYLCPFSGTFQLRFSIVKVKKYLYNLIYISYRRHLLLLLLLSRSVVSDSVRPHRRQPTRLLCPWDSPGKNAGVGCHFLLQCTKVKSEIEVAQLCLTLSDPMDCSLPGSSVHGIFKARVLEWVAIAFSEIIPIVY